MRNILRLRTNESGNALVIAISGVFIIGLLVTTMTTATVRSTITATETRAHAQAVAAAQGGMDEVVAKVSSGGNCEVGKQVTYASASGVTNPIRYKIVSVKYGTGADSQPTTNCTGSVPSSMTSLSVVIEGEAIANTNGRNASEDAVRIERKFEREVKKKFGAAVMAGARLSPDNGSIISSSDPSKGPADLVSHGYWGCYGGASHTQGNGYAFGGIKVSNPCVIGGDFYVSGNIDANYLEVKGDLYVIGDVLIHNNLKVGGNTYIDGNLKMGTSEFTGDLYVTRDVKYDVNQTFKGNLYVGGSFNPNYGSTTFKGDAYIKDGKSLANPNFAQNLASGKKIYISHPLANVTTEWFRTAVVSAPNGSNIVWNSSNVATQLSANLKPVPAALKPENHDALDLSFPFITKNDPMFQGATVIPGSTFLSAVGGTRSGAKCTVNHSNTKKISYTGKTVIDLSDCTLEIHNGHMELNITGDTYLLVKEYKGNTASSASSLTVRSNVNSGSLPTFGIIVPADPGQTTCAPAPGDHSVEPYELFFTNVKFVQTGTTSAPSDPKPSTQLFLYSAKKVRLGTSANPLYGQVYGCDVSSYSSQDIRYAIESAADESQSKLKTVFVRDVTD